MRQSDYSNTLTQTAASWFLAGGVLTSECVAAYQPKGALSLAASYINLNNPGTNNAAPGTAPSFATATGWTFAAASTQYLKTGIINQSGWSVIIRYSGIANDGVLFGSYTSTTTRFILNPNNTGDGKVYYQNGSFLGVSPAQTSGVLGIGGQQGYRNGIADGGAIGAWSGTNTASIIIGAYNADPTFIILQPITGSIQAVSLYNVTLSSTQVGLISAAMAAL